MTVFGLIGTALLALLMRLEVSEDVVQVMLATAIDTAKEVQQTSTVQGLYIFYP